MKRDPKLPGLEKVLRRYESLNGTRVLIGLDGRTAAGGQATPSELVTIGRAQEFGTATIPPRPFLRTALRQHRKKWVRLIAPAVRAVRRENGPARALLILRRAGVVMVGDTQATLRRGPWTPNAASTVRRKGSAQPLIDTGQMVQSIRAIAERAGARTEVIG